MILDELRDGLHEAVAVGVRRGHSDEAAVRAAVREFGSPAATAAGFTAELARSQARRTAAGYLTTGPLVGLMWLLALSPPGRSLSDVTALDVTELDVTALWKVVPPLPLIGIAVVIGGLVLAATGRPSRWVQLPARRVVDAAVVVIAVAVLSDLLILALAARSAALGATLIGALAIIASVIRLGIGVPTAAHTLRVRRGLAPH